MHLSIKQFHVSLQLLFETFFAVTNILGVNIQETCKNACRFSRKKSPLFTPKLEWWPSFIKLHSIRFHKICWVVLEVLRANRQTEERWSYFKLWTCQEPSCDYCDEPLVSYGNWVTILTLQTQGKTFCLFLCLFPSHEHMYISFRIDHSSSTISSYNSSQPLNIILGIQHCYSHVAFITSILVLICVLKKKKICWTSTVQ
jgi:hypothetical protein